MSCSGFPGASYSLRNESFLTTAPLLGWCCDACSSDKGTEAAAKAACGPWGSTAGAGKDSLIPGADEAIRCQRHNLGLGVQDVDVSLLSGESLARQLYCRVSVSSSVKWVEIADALGNFPDKRERQGKREARSAVTCHTPLPCPCSQVRREDAPVSSGSRLSSCTKVEGRQGRVRTDPSQPPGLG